MKPQPLIDPVEIAFDIDGVVANTMAVFVRLARERFGHEHLSLEDIRCYDLYQCLAMEKEILDQLICMTLDDEHTLQIPPLPGAPEVLSELAEITNLLFVTARIWPESITLWLHRILPHVSVEKIRVIASGAPDQKASILRENGIRFFVEDRLETCFQLKSAGIEPLLFLQPWNRNEPADGLIRIKNWSNLREWLLLP